MKRILQCFIIFLIINNNLWSQGYIENPIISGDDLLGTITKVEAFDLDQDGDMDVVSLGADLHQPIYFYENLGGGNFADKKFLFDSYKLTWGNELNAIDFDGDSDLDILASSGGNKVVWLVNDGNLNFTLTEVGSLTYDINDLDIADFDSDGDLDIVAASNQTGINPNEELKWFENIDGEYTEHLVADGVSFVRFVFADDIDLDGDQDILTLNSSAGVLEVYQNDGTGNFEPSDLYSFTNGDVRTAFLSDLNGDGYSDLVYSTNGSSGHYTYSTLNNGDLSFGSNQIVASTIVSGSSGTANSRPMDMDLDGDIDILETDTYYGRLRLFKNDSNGNFTEEITIFEEAVQNNAYYPCAGDFNEDGILDAAIYYDSDATSGYFDNISWFAGPRFALSTGETTCDDNLTPFYGNDDTVIYTLNVESFLGVEDFVLSSSDGTINQQTISLNDGIINFSFEGSPGSLFNLVVEEADNPNSFAIVQFQNVPNCAVNPEIFQANLVDIYCNDNGSSTDTTDDIIEFDLSFDCGGYAGNYTIAAKTLNGETLPISPTIASYGDTISFSTVPGTVGAGTIKITIRDENVFTLAEIIVISDPINCEDSEYIQGSFVELNPEGERLGFGASISVSENTAAISSIYSNWILTPVDGKLDIYEFESEEWLVKQTISNPEFEGADFFGYSVSLEGNQLLVGNPDEEDFGFCYYFEKEGESWIYHSKLTPSTMEIGDFFGEKVVVSGQNAVIASSRRFDDFGMVWIFEKDESDNWNEIQALTLEEATGGERFGASISMSGDFLFVLASDVEHSSENSQGSISVFKRNELGTYELIQIIPNNYENSGFIGELDSYENKLVISVGDKIDLYSFDGTSFELVDEIFHEEENEVFSNTRINRGFISVVSKINEQHSTKLFSNSSGGWIMQEYFVPLSTTFTSDAYGRGLDMNDSQILVGDSFNNQTVNGNGMTYFYQYADSFVTGVPSPFSSLNYEKNLLVYPNPVQESIYLDIDHKGIDKLEIYNLSGKKVLEKNTFENSEILIEFLPIGTYCIELTNKFGERQRSRFVKIH